MAHVHDAIRTLCLVDKLVYGDEFFVFPDLTDAQVQAIYSACEPGETPHRLRDRLVTEVTEELAHGQVIIDDEVWYLGPDGAPWCGPATPE